MLHQIGAGALGPVFRAYEPELDKLVAVKLLQLELPPDRVHQLTAELERLIAADLTHPAIAAVLATGISGNAAYLAQDFVGADALDVAVREHSQPPSSETIRIVAQLASALDSAAAAGVFHGALHPRDVLVSADDVRLTGLGIAQALERAGVPVQVRRPYTAPERAAGHPWDRRADVYGVAAIAYELITGRRFTSAAALGTDGLSGVAGADSEQLSRVFARALAEDPADRFDTAGAFAEGLRFALGAAAKPKRKADVEPRLREFEAQLPLESPTLVDLPLAAPPVQTGADLIGERTIVMAARSESAADVPASIPLATPPSSIVDDASPDVEVPQAVPASQNEARSSRFVRNRARGRMVAPDRTITPDVSANRVTDRQSRDLSAESSPDLSPGSAEAPPPASQQSESTSSSPTEGVPAASMTHPSVPSILTPPPAHVPLPAAQAGIWPIGLAGLVGLAVGFALGQVISLRPSAGVPTATTVVSQSELVPAVNTQADPPPAVPPGQQIVSTDLPPVINEPVPPVAPATPATAPPAATQRAPIASAPPPVAPVEGRLVVRSTPSGARVTVNGRAEGQTPATLGGLKPGTYTVRVTREGFAPQERRVVLSASRPASTVNVTLAAEKPAQPPVAPNARGSVVVESRPIGASVSVDGRSVGTTPVTLSDLSAGDYVIRIERDGYQAWSDTVRVVAGGKHRVAASLEPGR